ncbi:hypothetical protein E4K64_16885 [Bradyrhizobium frederickii]|uniref:Uncharacterized protein n=1 Tax=Bradyrhizobium frederickii TaxID=2560054 RepID=A0A4Y9P796_9BRAD|nr:hypothetical protein [Bradyrhizobium frederickii]TFV74533.1 hypothetical protein E4K64_16885 [Bradyrhizobium frederickii]
MRASTAYFVGAGTIVAAIAIGLGGGIVAGNIMNPVAPKQGPDTSKMAQRAESAGAPAATNAPSERVNYLTGSQAFGAMIAAPAQAEVKPEAKPEAGKPEAAKPGTQPAQATAEPPAPPPSQAAAVEPPKDQSKDQFKPTVASSPKAAKPGEQQASVDPASSLDNAYAKAKDSDVRRAASERRRIERRERWAERRHYYEGREPRGMRDRTDWDDVARNIREDSDARDYAGRPRGGFPQIRLFGPDDD